MTTMAPDITNPAENQCVWKIWVEDAETSIKFFKILTLGKKVILDLQKRILPLFPNPNPIANETQEWLESWAYANMQYVKTHYFFP